MKSFRNFLVKSTSECHFWLANKVSTDSNEYFLKFSLKVFRISLTILTGFHSFTVNEEKLQNQSIWRFLLRFGCAILVKILKWLKLFNSLPFIKKTLVNHVYIRIWSSWLTFKVLQWMKENSKLVNFQDFY